MWTNCDLDSDLALELKYYINDDFFEIKSASTDPEIKQNSKLVAYFYCENGFEDFVIGNFAFADDKAVLDKKYSTSYLKENGIDLKKFSHFKIIADNKKITAYPAIDAKGENIYSDRSVIRAKEVLSSVKSVPKLHDANEISNALKVKIKAYHVKQMPFMKEYTWYMIDSVSENFGLSAVKHLISSDDFELAGNVWYFGISPDDRIYAVAAKAFSDARNPLSNANDCTIVYGDVRANEFYFVVGILLLDDGQYFCRLS